MENKRCKKSLFKKKCKKNSIFLNPQGMGHISLTASFRHNSTQMVLFLGYSSELHSFFSPLSSLYLWFVLSCGFCCSTKNVCFRTFLYMCLVCSSLWARASHVRSRKFFPSFCTKKEFLVLVPFQMKNTYSFNRSLANWASTVKITVSGYLVILKWVLYEYLLPVLQ